MMYFVGGKRLRTVGGVGIGEVVLLLEWLFEKREEGWKVGVYIFHLV